MSKGDADIEMNFKVGNAAAANAIVRGVYQSQQSEMRKMQRSVDGLGMSIRKVGRSMVFGAAGYLGVTGLSSVFSSVAAGMNQVISKRAELEKAITPLSAVEDNAKNLGPIRREVLGTSVAMGRSLEEVGRFYADLVGSTGNLSSMERDQLVKETRELAELTGGDLVTSQNMLTKSYQIYGKELVNVNQLQNKLLHTQDEGSIEFSEMALRLPELLESGKVAGLNIDEVLGTVIGATRKSGSIEKTMTGLRNMFLIINDAEERGITLTGTYMDKVKQLQGLFKSQPLEMQKFFGREVIVHASSVTNAFDDISTAVTQLGKIMGDTDAVAEKLAAKFKDPTYFAFRDMENIENATAEASNLYPDMDNWLMRANRRGKLGALAAGAGTGGMFGPVGSISGYVHGFLGGKIADEGFEIAAATRDGDFFKQTMRNKFDEKKQADLDRLDARARRVAWTDGTPPAAYLEERAAIENRMPSPHLMTPAELSEQRAGSKNGGVDFSSLESAIRENTRALEDRGRVPGTAVKPGGARSNYEETI